MKKNIGWGVIGPGRIAYQFAESLRLLPDAHIAAAGSRDFERAKVFTANYGGKPYGSYAEMLADPGVDMVYVATPHPMHEEHVILSAEAGKGILCEKPFSVTHASSARMIETAKKNRVFLMEGLWSRFFPIWRKALGMIDAGEIGEVRVIESAMSWGHQKALPKDRLFDPALAGGGLLDAGAYVLSAAFMIMKGQIPAQIESVFHTCETGVDDDAAILFRYEKPDVLALLRCGLRSTGFDTRIIGGKGTLIIERHDRPSRMIHIKHEADSAYSRQEEIIEMKYDARGFQYELEAAMDAFREGKQECALTPWQETLNMAKINEDLRHKAGVRYPFEKRN